MDLLDLLISWQFCKQISSKCTSWQDLGSFKGEKKKYLGYINTPMVCQPCQTLII